MRALVFVSICLFFSGWALANPYAPDIREFSENSTLEFAGHPAFSLGNQSTLELWVAADWTQDPGYDPVVVLHAHGEQLLYALSVLGDRSGLSLQSGEQVDELPVSLTDGRLHHVALVSLANGVVLMVDGSVIGQFNVQLPGTTGTTLRLGGASDSEAPFSGALGGLRVWRIAVQRESLVLYALAHVFDDDQPHPDLEELAAYSDLHNTTIELMPLEED